MIACSLTAKRPDPVQAEALNTGGEQDLVVPVQLASVEHLHIIRRHHPASEFGALPTVKRPSRMSPRPTQGFLLAMACKPDVSRMKARAGW
jgi:hypothetical protein